MRAMSTPSSVMRPPRCRRSGGPGWSASSCPHRSGRRSRRSGPARPSGRGARSAARRAGRERHVVETTRPRIGSGNGASASSGHSSGSSSRANTRSAEATPDCSRWIMAATCVSGWVNWREYWMKACTSPMLRVPDATRSPPIDGHEHVVDVGHEHHTGWITPEMNCALNEARTLRRCGCRTRRGPPLAARTP